MIINNGTDTSFSEDKSYAKSSVVCDYGILKEPLIQDLMIERLMKIIISLN